MVKPDDCGGGGNGGDGDDMKGGIYRRAVSMELRELMDAQLKVYTHTSFKPHHDFMLRNGLNTRTRMLDVGCGNGAFTCQLALCHPEIDFVGLDFNEDLFQRAKMHAENVGTRNTEWVRGDVLDEAVIKQLGEVDGILMRFTAQHIAEIEKAFSILFRMIKSGGRIWIIDTELNNVISNHNDDAFAIYKTGLEKFYKNNGLDGHIGSKLPSLLEAASFNVVEISTDPMSNVQIGTKNYQYFLMHGAILLRKYDASVYTESDLELIGRFVEDVVPSKDFYGQNGVAMVAAEKFFRRRKQKKSEEENQKKSDGGNGF